MKFFIYLYLYRDCYGHLALNLYKLKFQFSLSYSIQLHFYLAKVKNMLKINDIEKKLAKSCKTGVILVIWYFTVLPCSSSSSSG